MRRVVMEIIHTAEWMREVASAARREERATALVPTMGALHQGHLSLVREAQRHCSPVVVSIFVNPLQFGPAEDFEKYPRRFDADRQNLEGLGVDYLYAPSPEEMYPPGFRTFAEVEGLGSVLEGRARPGHFRGVTTVVLKLFETVQPRVAFFGRKDAQQARIIQQMVRDLALPVELAICPIVREADGLASSSRNEYLSPQDRQAATVLYRSLLALRDEILRGERDAAHLVFAMRRVVDAEPRAKLDYAEVVDAQSFEPVSGLLGRCYALLAVRFGLSRLIDNALIEPGGQSAAGFQVTI